MVLELCNSLIQRASLFQVGQGDQESFVVDTEDLVAARVFKNFYDVHKSWVKNIKVDGNAAYREVAEQALRNNLYLFSPDHDHNEMFSGDRYYGSVRSNGVPDPPITYNYSGYLNEPLEYDDVNDLNTYWFRLPPMLADYIFELDENILKMVEKSDLVKDEKEY